MEQKLASRFVHTPSRLRTPVPDTTIPANIPNIVFTSCGPRKIQSGKCGNTFEGERDLYEYSGSVKGGSFSFYYTFISTRVLVEGGCTTQLEIA